MSTRLAERAQRVDESAAALDRLIRSRLHRARQEWLRASAGVWRYDFARLLGLKRAVLDERALRIHNAYRHFLSQVRSRLTHLESVLQERSPRTILERGYSITRDAAGRIVRDAASVAVGEELSIRLARGELGAIVRESKP